MIKNFGVMQGRLLRPIKNKIQSFPEKNWNKEFKIIKGLNLKFLEWTLDDKNLEKNPLLLHKGQNYIKRLCKKNNITINSITGDCFMQKPFWKKKGKQKKVLILKLKKVISSASRLKIKFIIIPLVDKGSIQSNLQKKNYHKRFM
jgi:hexulose-6-phosphate isomerase